MSQRSKREELRQKRTGRLWPMALIAGGVLLIGLVALAVGQAATPRRPTVPLEVSGAPRIKIDKERVDLGNVQLGHPVEVAFRVANVGDEPLRFTEAPYVELVEGC